MNKPCPLVTVPGQIIGFVNGRPVRTIAGGSEPIVTPPADPAAPPAAPASPPVVTPPAAPPAATQKVEDLPDWAQAIVRDVRKEAADARVAGKTAAEEAEKKLAQTIGKALGLVKDDEPGDPAKLTEQLTASQAETRLLKIERAAEKAARKGGADTDALLDSRTFVTELAKLDPDAATFNTALDALVKKAVTDNPKLKAGQAPPVSGASTPGGPGPAADIDAQIAAATKDGNHRLAISLKRQKAYTPPGA